MQSPLTDKTTLLLQHEIKQQALPSQFFQTVTQYLLPLASSIYALQQKNNQPVTISFNGAQGSGKSTLTHFIALLLEHHFKVRSITISLDDFYLTQQQRRQLAKDIHPLLKTRGVPGTHDIELALDTFHQLKNCSKNTPCWVPLFDKARDDRAAKKEWRNIQQPIDVILFEGWCNHAPIQAQSELLSPINQLEIEEDRDATWRTYVNEQLKIYHNTIFNLCDALYFIKIPSFEKVLEWRSLQEIKLANRSSPALEIMDKIKLERFIQHYERITKNCFATLPHIANTVIELDEAHQITKVKNLAIERHN